MDWTLVLVLVVLVAFLLIAGLIVSLRKVRRGDSAERSEPGEEGGQLHSQRGELIRPPSPHILQLAIHGHMSTEEVERAFSQLEIAVINRGEASPDLAEKIKQLAQVIEAKGFQRDPLAFKLPIEASQAINCLFLADEVYRKLGKAYKSAGIACLDEAIRIHEEAAPRLKAKEIRDMRKSRVMGE
jgi:hypothetical protein